MMPIQRKFIIVEFRSYIESSFPYISIDLKGVAQPESAPGPELPLVPKAISENETFHEI
jgi:hypothetical protein